VKTALPRSRRYSFVADIELTDVKSEARTRERTSNLSVFGCHVETRKPLSNGAQVRVKITHRGATFVALVGCLMPYRLREWESSLPMFSQVTN
jgi:hypothetical protein